MRFRPRASFLSQAKVVNAAVVNRHLLAFTAAERAGDCTGLLAQVDTVPDVELADSTRPRRGVLSAALVSDSIAILDVNLHPACFANALSVPRLHDELQPGVSVIETIRTKYGAFRNLDPVLSQACPSSR